MMTALWIVGGIAVVLWTATIAMLRPSPGGVGTGTLGAMFVGVLAFVVSLVFAVLVAVYWL